jgi:hypothetical protein
MKKILLTPLLSAALLISFACQSQIMVYDVSMGGHTIGTVKVLPHDQAGRQSRKRIEAEFSVPFYSGSFVSENHFLDGVLHSSSTEQVVNGRRKEQTSTKHINGQRYQFGLTEKNTSAKEREISVPIVHTITGLYYQEPVNVADVYSEKYGKICRVKKLDEGKYCISLPNGKESIYSYQGGQCTEIATELGGIRLSIVRKPGGPVIAKKGRY